MTKVYANRTSKYQTCLTPRISIIILNLMRYYKHDTSIVNENRLGIMGIRVRHDNAFLTKHDS